MGATDFGNQQLSYDYNQEATGKLFNRTNYKIIPTGIYEGFTISKLSNILVSIDPGVCLIEDAVNKVCVRVETANSQNVSVSNATPYLIFRMEWVDVPNCYMDMLAVAYGDIKETDLIVGKCIYDASGVTLSTNFDYTKRNDSFFLKLETQNNYLRVSPTEPPSNKVFVSSGVLNSSKGSLIISGGDFPSVGINPTINGRIDLVYVDEDGNIQILEGTDSSSPTAPRYGNRKVIAEIRRGTNKTIINGNEIYQVMTSLDVPTISSDFLINDAGNLYSSENLEAALQEIAGQPFTFKNTKTFQGAIDVQATTGKVASKIKGASGQNIEEVRKSDNTLVQRVDQNGRFHNTVGATIKIADTGNVFTTDEIEAAINQIASGAQTFKGAKTFQDKVTLSDADITTAKITTAYVTTVNASTVNTTSQRKKKKNIHDFDKSALDIINNTKIVYYTYKNDLSKTEHIGFIADDTPSELSGVKKDSMVISDTIGVILKAIQELNQKIEELK